MSYLNYVCATHRNVDWYIPIGEIWEKVLMKAGSPKYRKVEKGTRHIAFG